jgi:hypothetical protein
MRLSDKAVQLPWKTRMGKTPASVQDAAHQSQVIGFVDTHVPISFQGRQTTTLAQDPSGF